MPRALVLLLLATCCVAFPAFAGTNVTGTLWLSAADRSAARASGTRVRQRGVTDAVVWVEEIPERVEGRLAEPPSGWFGLGKKAPPPLPSVAQREDSFSPRVLAVPAGANVELANRDRLYHSTFSVSGAKRFDLGESAPGRRDTLAFERPGVVNLHCGFHPDAAGYVVVTPNHAFARPNAAGRFELPRLPAGRYVLRAWHPQKGELKLPFDVPRRGPVALDPSF